MLLPPTEHTPAAASRVRQSKDGAPPRPFSAPRGMGYDRSGVGDQAPGCSVQGSALWGSLRAWPNLALGTPQIRSTPNLQWRGLRATLTPHLDGTGEYLGRDLIFLVSHRRLLCRPRRSRVACAGVPDLYINAPFTPTPCAHLSLCSRVAMQPCTVPSERFQVRTRSTLSNAAS